MLAIITLISAVASMGIAFVVVPPPKRMKPPMLEHEPSPPRALPPEPEFEFDFDPLAFWLFPDWESGPLKEPFWMRPLRKPAPVPRETPRFASQAAPLPLLYGRTIAAAGEMVVWDGATAATSFEARITGSARGLDHGDRKQARARSRRA